MMDKPQILAVYAQVNAAQPRFKDVLEAERADAIKFLVHASDPVMLHRAQGKVALLDSMIELLATAHKHAYK